jgi:hypothetical protein
MMTAETTDSPSHRLEVAGNSYVAGRGAFDQFVKAFRCDVAIKNVVPGLRSGDSGEYDRLPEFYFAGESFRFGHIHETRAKYGAGEGWLHTLFVAPEHETSRWGGGVLCFDDAGVILGAVGSEADSAGGHCDVLTGTLRGVPLTADPVAVLAFLMGA